MGAIIWFVFLCFIGAITCDESDEISELDLAPTLKCREDEVVRCVYNCNPERTCRNRRIVYRCVVPQDPCKTKCVCKPGLYRNGAGKCVTVDKCD